MNICQPETERHCLSSLLRFPELISDIQNFIKEDDFASGRLNRTIYGAILDAQTKGQEVNSFLLSAKISNAGITFEELDGDVGSYLEELKQIQLTEKAALEVFKELKKLSVRREIFEIAGKLQKEMAGAKNSSIDEIIALSDRIYGARLSNFESLLSKDFSNIYEQLEEIIEERGNNPIEEFGFMGPFKRVNEIYGSLLMPGHINVVGARTGIGKTSMGHYYLTEVSEKYNVPILHLDVGEMPELDFQMRTCCMLTHGKVPLALLKNGKWRKNEELTSMVRHSWKRVKKLKEIGCHYKNVGAMSSEEIISTIRRFYYSKVGRGKPFLVHYDYLKAFSSTDKEYLVMGLFLKSLKNLITTEVPTSIWTSVQLNRSGIVGNKSTSMIDDTENTFSTSDMIVQQATHGWIFRHMTLEEQTTYPNMGNSLLINVKQRELGEDYQAALQPVRMSDGSLEKNRIFLKSGSFNFSEVGDLATLKDKIGILTPQHHDHDDSSGPARQSRIDEDVTIE